MVDRKEVRGEREREGEGEVGEKDGEGTELSEVTANKHWTRSRNLCNTPFPEPNLNGK